jgi:hypothetical protein
VKPKSSKVVIGFRLDERDRRELSARAEELNTTVSELVEQYVIAAWRESGYQEKIAGIPQKTEKVWLN